MRRSGACPSRTRRRRPRSSARLWWAGGEERLDLGLDRPRQHPPGTLAQHREERVGLDGSSWSRQRDDDILLRGVSSLVT
jgi:hypothetical protein